MSEAPTMAALTLASPDDELREDLAVIQHLSEANRSEARKDRVFEDGSVIVMRSRMGSEVETFTFANAEEAAAPMDPMLDPE